MKYIRWFLINGIFAVFLVLGTFYSQEWAMNIIRFCIPVLSILSTVLVSLALIIYIFGEWDKDGSAYKRRIPIWLEVAYDIPYIIILAMFQHYVLATLWTIQFIATFLYREMTIQAHKRRVGNK